MTIRAFLIVVIGLLTAGHAKAMNLEICNAGQDTFYLAHAETNIHTPYHEVAGWSSLQAGECWRRSAAQMQRVSLLVSYIDRNGRIGVLPFNRDFKDYGMFNFTNGPRRFCVDPVDSFLRKGVGLSESDCPQGLVPVPFTLYLAETRPNAPARLKISVDRNVLHEDYLVFPDPAKPALDPQEEKYADPGIIDMVNGPTSYQIEAAEYLNLKVRLAVANALLLKNGEMEIRDLTLDRCLSTKDDLFYCRYKIDVRFVAPGMQPLADLLNVGFFIKGYYWSSFWVNNGRWQIDRQWDSCTVGTDQIRCRGPKID